MAITIKNSYIAIFLTILLIGAYLLGGYFTRLRDDRAIAGIHIAYTDSIKSYRLKNDKLAYEKNQIIIEKNQLIASGLVRQAELKALNIKRLSEVTSLKATVKLLLDSIAHTGTVVIVKPCDSTETEGQPVIYLPFSFSDSTRYYKLEGELDEYATMRMGLSLPVGLDIFTGWDRAKKSYKAVVTSDNPYVTITDIKSIKVVERKPGRVGIGIQAGYGVTKTGLSPYIGAGINYNLIRF